MVEVTFSLPKESDSHLKRAAVINAVADECRMRLGRAMEVVLQGKLICTKEQFESLKPLMQQNDCVIDYVNHLTVRKCGNQDN